MPHPLGYSLIEEFNNIKKKEQSNIEKKKTRKKRVNKKVEKFLDSIDEDENEPFSDFNTVKKTKLNNPYERPTSAYNQIQNEREEGSSPTGDDVVNQEEFNTLQQIPQQNYYESYVPYFNNISDQQSINGEKDMLVEKLNYMIHLLEEQQEEKTGNVTEELILYSFLGVFIIFVIDSFARAGKYVR